MKYMLVLYMCSMVTGECPSSNITMMQYDTHFNCVVGGYKKAHNTFSNLEEMEDFEKEYIEEEKLVIKFNCEELNVDNT